MNWSLDIRNAVAFVTYDNPPENRLPFVALLELDDMLQRLGSEESVSVVVLASGVDGVFSAGADLADIGALRAGERPSAPFDSWLRTLLRIEELPQPTVAFIDGVAASGGAEIALACTMRVGTPRAEFAFREIARGAIPGAGATQRLPRLVGTAAAAEMILTARSVGADEALRAGLLQVLLPGPGSTPGSATDAAVHLDGWLARLASMPRGGLLAAKRAIVDGARLPLVEGLRLEQSLFRDLVRGR